MNTGIMPLTVSYD